MQQPETSVSRTRYVSRFLCWCLLLCLFAVGFVSCSGGSDVASPSGSTSGPVPGSSVPVTLKLPDVPESASDVDLSLWRDANGKLVGPLEATIPAVDEQLVLSKRYAQAAPLVESCMATAGFPDYRLSHLSVPEKAPSDTYGIVFTALAPVTAKAVLWDPDHVPADPAGVTAALTGSDASPGCLQKTNDVPPPVVSPAATEVSSLKAKLPDPLTDPSVAPLVPVWASCMNTAGYHVEKFSDLSALVHANDSIIIKSVPGGISSRDVDAMTRMYDFEKSLFRADQACQVSSGLKDAFDRVSVFNELQFIDTHQDLVRQAVAEVSAFNAS